MDYKNLKSDCTFCKGSGFFQRSGAQNGEYVKCPNCIKPLKVTLSMTDQEKEEVWKNQDSYIGRWLEYRAMMIGAKDVPRPPCIFIRFREDKE